MFYGSTMDEPSKRQITQCLIDLAARCDELGDPDTAIILMSVCAAMTEGSQKAMAYWIKEYARIRIAMLKKEIDEMDKSWSNIRTMITTDQLEHDLDIKARIQDYMVELDNMEEYIAPSQVVNRLIGIFARAEDAKFELKCRQGDVALDIS